MGVQYPVTPLLVTEHQWRISGIETPVIDQQIFEVLEEPFVWYEEPIVIEPEKTVVCAHRVVGGLSNFENGTIAGGEKWRVIGSACRTAPRIDSATPEHRRIVLSTPRVTQQTTQEESRMAFLEDSMLDILRGVPTDNMQGFARTTVCQDRRCRHYRTIQELLVALQPAS